MIKYLYKILLLICLNSFAFSQTQTIYGLTHRGGTDGGGVVFSVNSDSSNFRVLYNFQDSITAQDVLRVKLCEADSGKLYFAANTAGKWYSGAICSYNIYSNKYTEEFNFANGINDLPGLNSTLIKTSTGKLYGTSQNSHSNTQNGTIFYYDPVADTTVMKYNLSNANHGIPWEGLIEGPNGKLYGLITGYTASLSDNILFSFDTATNVFTVLHSFSDSLTGIHPVDNLVLANNGRIYGITREGGTNKKGVIYSYNPATNTYIKVFNLSDNITGSTPLGGMFKASDGRLYGTTLYGGDFGAGTIFRLTTPSVGGSISSVFHFKNDTTTGNRIEGELCEAGKGVLMGLTLMGGKYNRGTMFTFKLSNASFTKLQDFKEVEYFPPVFNDGSPMRASDGNVYGILQGGAFDNGFIYKVDTLNYAFTKLLDLRGYQETSPNSLSDYVTDGHLTGTSYYGLGMHERFFAIKLDSNECTYKNMGDIPNDYNTSSIAYSGKLANIAYPPVQASNGKLYGYKIVDSGDNSPMYRYIYKTDTITREPVFLKLLTTSNKVKYINKEKLIVTDNNFLYGRCQAGELGLTFGGFFKYNILNDSISVVYVFDSLQNQRQNRSFNQFQCYHSNGFIYGWVTPYTYTDSSTFFKLNTNTDQYLEKLFNFNQFTPIANSNGHSSAMVEAADGNIYISGYSSSSTCLKFIVYNPISDSLYYKCLPDFPPYNGAFSNFLPLCNGDLAIPAITLGGNAAYPDYIFTYNVFTDELKAICSFPNYYSLYPYFVNQTGLSLRGISTEKIKPEFTSQPQSATICLGDSVWLSVAGNCTGNHFKWYKNGNPLSVINDSLLIVASDSSSASGDYFCSVRNMYGLFDSSAVATVTIAAKPAVAFSFGSSAICIENGSFALQANPAGGTFSGPGVSANFFDPAVADTGTHVIYYSYAYGSGCSATDSITVYVKTCNGLNDVISSKPTLSIIPNPSKGLFSISGNIVLQNSPYEIIDLQGKPIKSGVINHIQDAIDARELPRGAYYLKVIPEKYTPQYLMLILN